MTGDAARALLLRAFEAAVGACQPAHVVPRALPDDKPAGRWLVMAIGKAAKGMASAALPRLTGEVTGLVVAPRAATDRPELGPLRLIAAGHPTPDAGSIAAGREILALAKSARGEDHALFLVSGGGSSLLCAPIPGVSAARKQDINRFLLLSGAPIEEINRVRTALSMIKGGRLAAAAAERGASLTTIVISDVVGDDPSLVASGPSVSSNQTPAAAAGILRRYGYAVDHDLETAMLRAAPPVAVPHEVKVVASNADALRAAEAVLRDAGADVLSLGDAVAGDAAATGALHAKLAKKILAGGQRVAILSGGELTVHVTNPSGRGGPNLVYLAAFALALPDGAPITALACDTDGLDGCGGHAGGIATGSSMGAARRAGLDPPSLLAANRSYDLFAALQDLIVIGPTGTNVNDIRIILVEPSNVTRVVAS